MIYGRIINPAEEGRISFEAGKAKSQNPYPPDSLKYFLWNTSWEQSQHSTNKNLFFKFKIRNIMNEREFLNLYMAESGQLDNPTKAKKQFDDFINTLKKVFIDSDDNTKLIIRNFGTFTVAKRDARKGQNPRTGETIDIPPKRVVKFKAGKALDESLNA